MRLTWKDAVTTGALVAAVAVYVAFLVDADIPVLTGVRPVTLAVAFFAIIGSSFSGINDAFDDRVPGLGLKTFRVTISTVGVAALVAGILAFVMASELMLAIFVIAAAATWLMSAVRRALTAADRPADIQSRRERTLR